MLCLCNKNIVKNPKEKYASKWEWTQVVARKGICFYDP